jgi:hypothetical protein
MMNRHNVILWDGSFTAAFTYFLVAGGILGGGDADPDPLDAPGFRTPGMVWPFRQGGPEGRPAVCIGAVERTVTLACPPDKVEARDWLDEPIPVTPASQGRCQVKLPANYSYLYDKGLGRDRFYAVIREAETDDPLPGEEPVQFRAWLRREGQRLSQVVILQGKPAKTAAVPIAPFGATDLTGKPRWRVLASVQPWDPRRPAVPEVLNRSNPVSFWRSPAVRNVSARPDADLGEWLALSRNDIYVTESFLGRYDRKFWHAHKDAFRIATDLGRDFRVYWWAGWNEAGLLLAARVNDDDVRPGPAGDRLDLHVAADWPPAFDPAGKDKGELAALPDPTVRRFAVRLAEGGGLAVLDPEGKAVAGATGAWRRRPDPWGGYDLEMVLPWRDAGVARPAAGVEIGFDLIAWDVDEVAGLPGEAALRWAGGARPLGVLELVP